MAGLNLGPIAALVEGLVMLDTVRITRPAAGQPVFNESTGQYEYPAAETVYEGPGAVQTAGAATEVVMPGANLPWAMETRSKYRMLTPLTAPVAEKDMLVTVVAVHAGGDVELLDRQWRVQDPGAASTIGVARITSLDQVQATREIR